MNKEDLTNLLNIKRIDNNWYISESSFRDKEDLDFLLREGIIKKEGSDSCYIYFDKEIKNKDVLIKRLEKNNDYENYEEINDKSQIISLWLVSHRIGEIIKKWQQYHKRKPPFEDIERPKETIRDYISKDILKKSLREFYKGKDWLDMIYDLRYKKNKSHKPPCPLPEHKHKTIL